MRTLCKKLILDLELKLVSNIISECRNNGLIYLWVYGYNINPSDLEIETTQVGWY